MVAGRRCRSEEGGLYGVSLALVSQRPSELATGILSQCNTIFALRLSNQKDQAFVRAAMSESAIGLMDEFQSSPLPWQALAAAARADDLCDLLATTVRPTNRSRLVLPDWP